MPAAETFSTTVKKDPSDTFTITMATINEASKTASPKIRACYKQGGPGCQSTTTITKLVEYDANVAADQRQMPSFMTRNGAALTVSATDNAQAKAYTMEVTHSTPDNGDQVYRTVTITIGWCVITHIDPPTTPTSSDTDYIIFSGQKEITLTPQFAQKPACGYSVVETITWTIP